MSKMKLRKNGIYELKIQHNNKRYYVYSKSQTELKEKFKKLKKDLIQQKVVYKNITLEKFYFEWFKTFKKPFVTTETAYNIQIYFEKHILPILGNEYLKNLNSTAIQQYLNSINKSRTKELITTYLKAILTKAFDLDLIKANPFRNVVKEKKLNNIRPSLNIKQQKQLLDYLKNNDIEFYQMTMLYLVTGIRRSEIGKLEFKDRCIIVHGTKTQKSLRQIPMSEKFKQEIIDKINIEKLKDIKEKGLSAKYGNLFNKLKIDATLHSLRHTFATNLYNLKYPAKQVQQWLGHASITMTLDVYTNLNNDDSTEIKAYWRDWYPQI